jgi:hypothetical protein
VAVDFDSALSFWLREELQAEILNKNALQAISRTFLLTLNSKLQTFAQDFS